MVREAEVFIFCLISNLFTNMYAWSARNTCWIQLTSPVTPIASWTRKWRKCNNVTIRSAHAFEKSKTSTRDRREDWFMFAKISAMIRRSRNMPSKDHCAVDFYRQSNAKWEKMTPQASPNAASLLVEPWGGGAQDTNWYMHKLTLTDQDAVIWTHRIPILATMHGRSVVSEWEGGRPMSAKRT
jgi:hypothetical protein